MPPTTLNSEEPVIRSSSGCRIPRDTQDTCVYLHIMKGCYVRVDDAQFLSSRWSIWEAVSRARLLAVQHARSEDRVFIGASALVARGIPLWEANPDVCVWTPSRRGHKSLRAVQVEAVRVPAVSLRWSVVPPNAPELEQVEGITVEGIVDAGVRMALFSEHSSAFVALCMLLNRQSQFSVFTQDVDRQRSDGLRENMLARLEERATGKETIPFRRAKRLIVAADPGCENPAEAALLWVVKSVSAFEVVTQFEIIVNGRRYFADIAIPGLMIIFEFDGIGKLGKNEVDFARAKRDWIQRENDLRGAGWTIYRFSWPDYEDLTQLRSLVSELLGPFQSVIPSSAQGLWAKPTPACDGPERRFHMAANRWGTAREDYAR